MITAERGSELILQALWRVQTMRLVHKQPVGMTLVYEAETYRKPLGKEETRFYKRKFNAILELYGVFAEWEKRLAQVRSIASKGGKSTAHYTYAQITVAFTDYRERNPGKTAWEAANALIRKGQPLDKYKKVTGPWNQAKRIAENTLGLSVEDWFADL